MKVTHRENGTIEVDEANSFSKQHEEDLQESFMRRLNKPSQLTDFFNGEGVFAPPAKEGHHMALGRDVDYLSRMIGQAIRLWGRDRNICLQEALFRLRLKAGPDFRRAAEELMIKADEFARTNDASALEVFDSFVNAYGKYQDNMHEPKLVDLILPKPLVEQLRNSAEWHNSMQADNADLGGYVHDILGVPTGNRKQRRTILSQNRKARL